MISIIEWMVEQGIAVNGFAAGHIAEGLQLNRKENPFTRSEQEAMCKLYRRWRPKTDKKNELTSREVYDLVLAGIEPENVKVRQIDLFNEAGIDEEDDNYGYEQQKNFD